MGGHEKRLSAESLHQSTPIDGQSNAQYIAADSIARTKPSPSWDMHSAASQPSGYDEADLEEHMSMSCLVSLWSRPLCDAVGTLNKRIQLIWRSLHSPSSPSMSPELKSSALLLFAEMDRSSRGHVSRSDARAFFAEQPDPEEHVDAFFDEVGVWTKRADGDVDWAACEHFWQTYLGPFGVSDSDLLRLCEAVLRHRSWRWDDGRHLHQHAHQDDFPL